MKTFATWCLAATACLLLAACLRVNVQGDPRQAEEALRRIPDDMARAMSEAMPPVRFATYNTSLYSDEAGGVEKRLKAGDAEARKVAAVLQKVRPDVVLLNEFDYDKDGRAAKLFREQYLEKPQKDGGEALLYPFMYYAPVNTGVPSGFDLDRSGKVGGAGRERGNDAWGYGLHPGQYGMLVLSRYPIETSRIRTFQKFRWSAMPDARAPRDPATGQPWYSDAAWKQFPLSSKSHWDVPISTPQGEIHFLVSHPTPPTFDGAENRNGLRNHDELRLWSEYVSGKPVPWLCDDGGKCGGIADDARFVIAGDLNADAVDGDGLHEAILQLLQHPRINAEAAPGSEGATVRAKAYGLKRAGNTGLHTADFGPKVGTLRLDYVLPSRGLHVREQGVFWPAPNAADAAIITGTDHRLVWADLSRRPL